MIINHLKLSENVSNIAQCTIFPIIKLSSKSQCHLMNDFVDGFADLGEQGKVLQRFGVPDW